MLLVKQCTENSSATFDNPAMYYSDALYFINAYPPATCIAIPGRPIRKSCTAWKKLPTITHSPKVPAT